MLEIDEIDVCSSNVQGSGTLTQYCRPIGPSIDLALLCLGLHMSSSCLRHYIRYIHQAYGIFQVIRAPRADQDSQFFSSGLKNQQEEKAGIQK